MQAVKRWAAGDVARAVARVRPPLHMMAHMYAHPVPDHCLLAWDSDVACSAWARLGLVEGGARRGVAARARCDARRWLQRPRRARLLAPAARSGYDFAQTDQDRKDVSREHLISRPIN